MSLTRQIHGAPQVTLSLPLNEYPLIFVFFTPFFRHLLTKKSPSTMANLGEPLHPAAHHVGSATLEEETRTFLDILCVGCLCRFALPLHCVTQCFHLIVIGAPLACYVLTVPF
jgi:hypothetical protein